MTKEFIFLFIKHFHDVFVQRTDVSFISPIKAERHFQKIFFQRLGIDQNSFHASQRYILSALQINLITLLQNAMTQKSSLYDGLMQDVLFFFTVDCNSNRVKPHGVSLGRKMKRSCFPTFCLETKGGAKNSRLLLIWLIPNPFL
jgi:hypothetical protein